MGRKTDRHFEQEEADDYESSSIPMPVAMWDFHHCIVLLKKKKNFIFLSPLSFFYFLFVKLLLNYSINNNR